MNYGWALASALMASLAAGGPSGKGTLKGQLDIGPISPVERPGHPSKPSPELYRQLTVIVYKPGPSNGRMKSHLLRIVAKPRLSENGTFEASLDPGEYQVGVESEKPLMHPPARKSFVISTGKTTHVVLRIDTGIR